MDTKSVMKEIIDQAQKVEAAKPQGSAMAALFAPLDGNPFVDEIEALKTLYVKSVMQALNEGDQDRFGKLGVQLQNHADQYPALKSYAQFYSDRKTNFKSQDHRDYEKSLKPVLRSALTEAYKTEPQKAIDVQKIVIEVAGDGKYETTELLDGVQDYMRFQCPDNQEWFSDILGDSFISKYFAHGIMYSTNNPNVDGLAKNVDDIGRASEGGTAPSKNPDNQNGRQQTQR